MVKRDFSADRDLNDWIINKLASVLDTAGTQSILNLVYYENQAQNLSFFYDQMTGHVYNQGMFKPSVNGGGPFLLTTRDYRWDEHIYLFFTKDGFPVFWNQHVDTGSDWAGYREIIVVVGSAVLSFVGVPAAIEIGTAVLGAELAAAYPALAQGIGQVVMSTLMNGGDIEKGVQSAVASYVGAGVGGQVASGTGSNIIGQASAAATRAYINGGDPAAAVAQTLLQNGVNGMGTLLLSSTATTGAKTMGDYYTDENGVTFGVDSQGALATVDFVDEFGIGYATDANGDLQVLDAPTTADLAQTYTGSDSNGTVPYDSPAASTTGLATLTQLAMAALPLVNAYVRAGMPAMRAGSVSSTVNANGTITTRNPNGSTTTTKPAAGTPYASVNGNVITNNGDGTFTTVSPNGAISTQRYPAISSKAGGISQPVMIGLGVLAVLALAR